jgi:hypothetical protein
MLSDEAIDAAGVWDPSWAVKSEVDTLATLL